MITNPNISKKTGFILFLSNFIPILPNITRRIGNDNVIARPNINIRTGLNKNNIGDSRNNAITDINIILFMRSFFSDLSILILARPPS